MTVPAKIIVAPSAQHEVVRAADWYEEREAGRGQDFVNDFDRTLARIANGPKLFQVVQRKNGREARRAMFGFYPYALLFHEVEEGLLRVGNVYHQRRPPPLS